MVAESVRPNTYNVVLFGLEEVEADRLRIALRADSVSIEVELLSGLHCRLLGVSTGLLPTDFFNSQPPNTAISLTVLQPLYQAIAACQREPGDVYEAGDEVELALRVGGEQCLIAYSVGPQQAAATVSTSGDGWKPAAEFNNA